MRPGYFVTFEGLDGCGKSTQIALAEAWCQQQGFPVRTTREPGGTKVAEAIRLALLDPAVVRTPDQVLRMLSVARRDHVDELIRPSLEEGIVVICDRFVDSTMVYQGVGQGISHAVVMASVRWAVQGCWPDVTFFLDAPVPVLRRRIAMRREAPDALSRTTELLRRAYRGIAQADPTRVVVIDATPAPAVVAQAIVQVLSRCLVGPEG